jgi:hypothetical protein
MNNRNWNSLNISGNSGPVTLGDIGAGAAVGAGGNVSATGPSPELLVVLNKQFEALIAGVAQLAHAHALDQRRIDVLAGDLDRLRKSIVAERPDEREFRSAASSLWNKLDKLGEGMRSATGLAQALTGIAKLFGWTLAL